MIFIFFGIREEYTSLGIKQIDRELGAWIEQGQALEAALLFMIESIPESSSLVVVGPPFSGMQIPEQIESALVLFDRLDISVSYTEQDTLGQILSGIIDEPSIFLVSTNPLESNFMANQERSMELVYQSGYNKYDGYIYALTSNLNRP